MRVRVGVMRVMSVSEYKLGVRVLGMMRVRATGSESESERGSDEGESDWSESGSGSYKDESRSDESESGSYEDESDETGSE